MSDKLKLTPRQREVLELVVQNVSRREIAERLVLSLHTVKGTVQHARDRNGGDTLERLCYLLGLEEGRIPVCGSVTGTVPSTVNVESAADVV